ncbi:hypothetical protein [Protaetiibacter mangrovi]|uniref:Cell division protein CrgA n=1 Tax=Protaetiibacter mangrovi TaxID=2970926 RepID=A0ABT1ZFB5_9MICO|nr:hypothetical protein [Protaetiibacter mangrovi]MCS0499400.1 hypothetical protein [Protaetiibacter mangrovi]TPW98689.1 hypothetical protein FJ656_33470 [Schumannella luteola]
MAQKDHDETLGIRQGSKLTGFLVGLLVAVGVIVPFTSAIGFATHPYTQRLFSGRLADVSQGGYVVFWWLVAAILAALPFLVGYAVDRLSTRGLSIMGGVFAVVVIVALVLGIVFVF